MLTGFKTKWGGFKEKLTYANVVSSLCLFAVLGGGTAIAAIAAKDSVTSKSIKNGSVKGKDVKADTLTGGQINEGTLDVSGLQGPEGPAGAKGDTGPAGPATGAAGGDLTGSYPNPEIAANAVGSPEVANDSLQGADIIESSLLQVPSAAVVGQDAGTVESYFYDTLRGDNANTTLFDIGGVKVTAACPVEPSKVLVQSTAVTNNGFVIGSGPDDPDWDLGETVNLKDPLDATGSTPVSAVLQTSFPLGNLTIRRTTTMQFAYETTATRCKVVGTVTTGLDID